MRALRFIQAEYARQLRLLGRYPLQTAASVVGLIVLSLVAWFGIHATFFNDRDYQSVSSVLVWPLVMVGLGFTSTSLQEDITLGTIEQLYVASPSAIFVLHCRAVVYLTISILMTSPLWLLGAYYLGGTYLLSWLLLNGVPLLLTTYGLGLIVGGLTLLYRRTGELGNLLSLGLVSLTLVSLPWPEGLIGLVLRSAFPMADVSGMAPQAGWAGVILRYGAAILYLAAGQLIFSRMEIRAKRLGVIGRY